MSTGYKFVKTGTRGCLYLLRYSGFLLNVTRFFISVFYLSSCIEKSQNDTETGSDRYRFRKVVSLCEYKAVYDDQEPVLSSVSYPKQYKNKTTCFRNSLLHFWAKNTAASRKIVPYFKRNFAYKKTCKTCEKSDKLNERYPLS